MLSEKIGLEFDLFEVSDRKFGSYNKVGTTVSVHYTLCRMIKLEVYSKQISGLMISGRCIPLVLVI